MVRVRRSVSSRKSRKKILKQAKGYTGARSKRLRTAKEQVMHAGNDAFAHRKDKKATYRKIWIYLELMQHQGNMVCHIQNLLTV